MSNEIQKTEGGGELVVVNKAEFIQKYDPAAMITSCRKVKTPAQAIEKDPNGVAFYAKHLGEDAIMAVIELHLIALNQSVNVGQPLTKFQIKEIAIEILSEFYYLSMVEINLIFRRAKRGDFGKLYGVLNMVDVLTWFREYSEERAAHFIQESTKHKQRDTSMRSEDRKAWEKHERIINKNNADNKK